MGVLFVIMKLILLWIDGVVLKLNKECFGRLK